MHAAGEFLSWESRYVGAVRALNTELLDSYLLKSLDGGFQVETAAENMAIYRCGYEKLPSSDAFPAGTRGNVSSKLCVFEVTRRKDTRSGTISEQLVIGTYNANDKKAMELLDRFGGHVEAGHSSEIRRSGVWGAAFVDRLVQHNPRRGEPALRYSESNIRTQTEINSLLVNPAFVSRDTVDDLMEFGLRSSDSLPNIYDTIYTCLGWHHNRSIYDDVTAPFTSGKFPIMTHEYESANVPGLFFAGAASHGRDAGRAAGGFIHGFRYSARALVRILLSRDKGIAPGDGWEAAATRHFTSVHEWDGVAVGDGVGHRKLDGELDRTAALANSSGLPSLIEHMFHRINSASGPYQMVSELGDGIVFRCPVSGATGPTEQFGKKITAEYLEEIPVAHFHAKFAGLPRAIWTFG